MTDREILEMLLEGQKEIKVSLDRMEKKVTAIEMTIENEIQPNIMRVAEGHIDLYRNLKDVKGTLEMIDGKIEMYDLNIKHHESEIKKLKLVK